MQRIRNTNDQIALVRDWKAICESTGLNIFLTGWLYTQTEQFLELEQVKAKDQHLVNTFSG